MSLAAMAAAVALLVVFSSLALPWSTFFLSLVATLHLQLLQTWRTLSCYLNCVATLFIFNSFKLGESFLTLVLLIDFTTMAALIVAVTLSVVFVCCLGFSFFLLVLFFIYLMSLFLSLSCSWSSLMGNYRCCQDCAVAVSDEFCMLTPNKVNLEHCYYIVLLVSPLQFYC